MVVIGGTGTRWGAVIGGILYTYLDNRLLAVRGRETVQDLPACCARRSPSRCSCSACSSSCIVYFFPGGIVGLSARGRARARRRIESAVGRQEQAEAGV